MPKPIIKGHGVGYHLAGRPNESIPLTGPGAERLRAARGRGRHRHQGRRDPLTSTARPRPPTQAPDRLAAPVATALCNGCRTRTRRDPLLPCRPWTHRSAASYARSGRWPSPVS